MGVMAGSKKRRSKGPLRFFSQRNLITLETLLAVGLAQVLAMEWMLLQPTLAPWVRVCVGMILTVGLFGGIFIWAQKGAHSTLKLSHRGVQKLPSPTPKLAVHTCVLAGLFLGYCFCWRSQVGSIHQILPWLPS